MTPENARTIWSSEDGDLRKKIAKKLVCTGPS